MSTQPTRLAGNLIASVGVIAILTLASRLVGFVRTLVESWVLGATSTATAYATANNVPNVLFEVAAGGALAGAVVPLLAGFVSAKAREKVSKVASALLTWTLTAGVPVALLVVFLARPLASLLLGNEVPGETVDLATTLLRVFAIQIPLYGLSVVFAGILQAHRRFTLPALAPLLSSLVVITSFAAFNAVASGAQSDPDALSTTAVNWLAWGTTAGVAVFSLCQLPPVLRRVTIRPTYRFPDGVGKKAARLAGAGLGMLISQQVAIVVIMLVGNHFGGTGAFPIFKYANAVYMLPYAVLAVPIATAVFPRIAERADMDGRPGLAHMVAGSVRLVVAVAAAGSAVLAAAAPQVEIFLGLQHPMYGLANTLTILSVGILGFSLLYHCSRLLLAVDAPRGALVGSAAGWLTVVVVAAGGAAAFATDRLSTLAVLATATVIGMVVAGIVLLWRLSVAIGHGSMYGLAKTLVVAVGGALVGALLGRFGGDAVVDLVGRNLWGAIGGAMLAAIIALSVPILLTVWLDRSTWYVRSWAHDVSQAGQSAESFSAESAAGAAGDSPRIVRPGVPDRDD